MHTLHANSVINYFSLNTTKKQKTREPALVPKGELSLHIDVPVAIEFCHASIHAGVEGLQQLRALFPHIFHELFNASLIFLSLFLFKFLSNNGAMELARLFGGFKETMDARCLGYSGSMATITSMCTIICQ